VAALNAPDSLKVATLNAKHEGYRAKGWGELWALYAGGQAFDADKFIRERRSEPLEILNERRERAFYLGYMGEIVDLFASNLFLKPLEITPKRGEKAFWEAFAKNVDTRNTHLSAFMLERWVRALVQRFAYTWIDLPKAPEGATPTTLRDQDDMGLRQAYLIPVNADEVFDSRCDDAGLLEWAIVHKEKIQRPSPFSLERSKLHRWTILHREGIATYVAEEKLEQRDGGWKATGKLENEHAQLESDIPNPCGGRVPLARICLPEALCIGDKLDGIQRHLTEMDNAISWQQFMSLFAMPVVKSAKQFNQAVGESYFIQLDPEDEFTWSEPAGTALKASMDRRESLKDEMFRIAHQMAQSVQSNAETAARSGESKRRDRTPTEIVLDALGDLARQHAREVARLVALSRGEPDDDIDVAGCDEFDLEDDANHLDDELKFNALAIPSKTLATLRAQRTVRRRYPDFSPADLKKIDAEIIEGTTAPDPAEEPGDLEEPPTRGRNKRDDAE
jgi:hypothetical protein